MILEGSECCPGSETTLERGLSYASPPDDSNHLFVKASSMLDSNGAGVDKVACGRERNDEVVDGVVLTPAPEGLDA